jgi:hypothetical protein
MNPVLAYLWGGILLTAQELALLFGPALVLGLAIHYLAETIRYSCLRLMGVNVFGWLTAPGTMVHELGHAFFCLIFGHEVRDLALFKPNNKDSLGHVTHAYNPWNPYHMVGHFFIGTGPIWFGAAILYGLAVLLLGHRIPMAGLDAGFSLDDFPGTLGRIGVAGWQAVQSLFEPSLFRHWPVYVFLYLAFSIGAHMTLSLSDLGGTLKGFLYLALVVLLLNWAVFWAGDWSPAACLFLLRPLTVIYGVMAFAALLSALLALLLGLLAAGVGKLPDPAAGRTKTARD